MPAGIVKLFAAGPPTHVGRLAGHKGLIFMRNVLKPKVANVLETLRR